jgi:putative peptidoglycan lipid II flippase
MTGRSRSILRSTVVISGFTAISRLLGLVREILMAVLFGTSLPKSAFDVAFTIPNLFRRLFGEGALSAAFVPVMTETLTKEGLDEANKLVSRAMTMLGVALAAIVLGGVLMITVVLGAGMELAPKAAAVLPLLRIMLPYMFFICLVAMCMAVLNSLHHFAVPAATPVVLNVVWILVLVFLCPKMGRLPSERIYGVAFGVLVAGALQLAVQLPVLLRHGIRPTVTFAWRDRHIVSILALMGPAALGMGVHQVNVCVDRLLALWAAPWAPAALTFAERLVYLPLGIFATALGTVLLPTFSRQAAEGNHDEVRLTLRRATSNLMVVMIPAAVGLGVLAVPIVRLMFEWRKGVFNAESTLQTARALWLYAPGLVVFSLYKMLVPAFYALKDTRTPVRVGLRVVGLNFALNLLFVLTWPQAYKHAGLALATVIASAVNSAVLARILARRIGSIGWTLIALRVAKISVAAGVMGGVAYVAHPSLEAILRTSAMPAKGVQILALGGTILLAIGAYALTALVVCRDELRQFLADRRRRG